MSKKLGPTPRKKFFAQEFPEQFTMLQCARKSMSINKEFVLEVNNDFHINTADYKMFGKHIEQYKIGRLTPTGDSYYKVILSKEFIVRIKHMMTHIRFSASPNN